MCALADDFACGDDEIAQSQGAFASPFRTNDVDGFVPDAVDRLIDVLELGVEPAFSKKRSSAVRRAEDEDPRGHALNAALLPIREVGDGSDPALFESRDEEFGKSAFGRREIVEPIEVVDDEPSRARSAVSEILGGRFDVRCATVEN